MKTLRHILGWVIAASVTIVPLTLGLIYSEGFRVFVGIFAGACVVVLVFFGALILAAKLLES